MVWFDESAEYFDNFCFAVAHRNGLTEEQAANCDTGKFNCYGCPFGGSEAVAVAYMTSPPCNECGAMTPEEAEKLCRCGGDRDYCNGCDIWPD